MHAIRRVVCGMSGGVDSAVAALLLKRRGFDVVGAFMKNWDQTDETGVCSSDQDREHAEYVCKHLNIPLHDVNFVKEYWNDVFVQMIQGYENGTTPNPDVLCNRHVKFGHFYDYATQELGADAVATGHYARNSAGNFLEYFDPSKDSRLLSPVDTVKDQTLFLCQIRQRVLQRTMFPLGDLLKSKVRRLAREAGMEKIASRKESMGICFIGSRHFHSFIEEYIEPKMGNFINIETGEVVGQHKGTHYWTVGQRSHISGKAQAFFIVEVNPRSQNILVAPGTDHPSLFCQSFTISRPHWIHSEPHRLTSHGKFECQFRFQHTHPTIGCSLTVVAESEEVSVELEHPLRAITAGQYAVFYDGEECIGSGLILRPGQSLYCSKNEQQKARLKADVS